MTSDLYTEQFHDHSVLKFLNHLVSAFIYLGKEILDLQLLNSDEECLSLKTTGLNIIIVVSSTAQIVESWSVLGSVSHSTTLFLDDQPKFKAASVSPKKSPGVSPLPSALIPLTNALNVARSSINCKHSIYLWPSLWSL